MEPTIDLRKLRGTNLYNCFRSMKQRCYYSNGNNFKYYGGRGITICDEWLNDRILFFKWSFENGYSKNLSLDRIDTDGNYEPNNCRWVLLTVQKQNRSIRHDNLSGYIGVSWSPKHKKYRAQINVNKKRTHLGLFLNQKDGAIAYNNYIIKNNLNHKLNKVD